MKKKPKVVVTKPKESSLQKRLFELHAQADSRSDEEQARRAFLQNDERKFLKRKQRR